MSVISLKTKQKYGTLLAGNAFFMPSAFESIATATGTGSNSEITFSNIPQTYQHLEIRFITKSTYSTADLGWSNALYIITNGSSSIGRSHFMYGNGSSTTAESSNTDNYIQIYGGQMSSASGTSNMFSAGIINIHDYSSTTKNKTIRAFAGCSKNAGSNFYGPALSSGFNAKTVAISSITIYSAFNNFASGSQFALYGIKGA